MVQIFYFKFVFKEGVINIMNIDLNNVQVVLVNQELIVE